MRSTGAAVAIAGRRREMAVVARLVDTAGAGTGGALLITGEAGIGKSRLVTETIALARSAGLAVLTGRAVPGGGTYRAVAEAVLGHVRDPRVVADAPQLRPFRAALDRLAPGWVSGSVEDVGADDGLGGGGPDPVLMLGEGVLRLLAVTGSGRGSLLVLEDLHCADADTIAVVEYLAGAVRGSPVLLVVSARDDQPGQHNSVAVARLAGREDVTTLRLDRLDSGAVRELAFASADGTPIPDDVMERLVAQAEGLPLLVGELLDGLLDPLDGDPVPPTLAGLVAGRMAELAPRRVGCCRPLRCSGPSLTGHSSHRSVAWTRRPRSRVCARAPARVCSSGMVGACGGGIPSLATPCWRPCSRRSMLHWLGAPPTSSRPGPGRSTTTSPRTSSWRPGKRRGRRRS